MQYRSCFRVHESWLCSLPACEKPGYYLTSPCLRNFINRGFNKFCQIKFLWILKILCCTKSWHRIRAQSTLTMGKARSERGESEWESFLIGLIWAGVTLPSNRLSHVIYIQTCLKRPQSQFNLCSPKFCPNYLQATGECGALQLLK